MYSRTWENADGTRTAEIATRPMHYQAADGSLQPIVTALTATSRAGFAAANETNPLRTYLPANAAGWVRVETGRAAVSFRPVAASPGGIAVTGGRATYGVSDNASIAYQVEPGRLKEAITLTSPPADPVFSFELIPEGVTPRVQKDGSVVLANEAGEVTLLIEAPWMQDAKGRISYSVAVRVLHSSGGFLYEVLPDQKWLSEAAYPVKIDPTVSYNPSWTGTVDSALPNQQFVPGLPTDHDGMCLAVGGQPTHELRSVLHFGATLPLDADIDSAILSMDLRINEKASPLEIQAHALPTALSPGGSPYPSPTWNNVGASVPGGPASAPVVVNAVATYYWDVFDIVRSWDESRDDNAPVELNILMRATTSWYNTVLFATQDKAPKITVTYSEGWTTLQGNRRRQGRTQYAISSSPTERWDTALTDGPSQPGEIAIPPGILAVPDFQNRNSGRPAVYVALSSDNAESRLYRIRDNGTSSTSSSVPIQGVTLTGTPLAIPGPTISSDTIYVVGNSTDGYAHIYKYVVQVSSGQIVWNQAAHQTFAGEIPSSPVFYPRSTTYTLRKTGGALEQATSSAAIIVSATIANKGYLVAFSPQNLKPVWGRVVEATGQWETVNCQHTFAEPGGLCRLGTSASMNVVANESSPCLVGHSVYVQDTSCFLNVRSASSGAWEAPGELMPTLSGVRGSVSSMAGRLYYGDLGGVIVGAETSPFQELWQSPATALLLPNGDPFSLDSIMTTGAFSAENACVLYRNDAGQILTARTDYDPAFPQPPLLWGIDFTDEWAPARSSPLVAGAPGSTTAVAFLGGDDAKVRVVNPSTGLHIADIPAGGSTLTGGIVRSDMAAYRGRLYVLTSGRQTDLTPIGWARLHCYY